MKHSIDGSRAADDIKKQVEVGLDVVNDGEYGIMWAKFESLIERARIASDELWGR